MDKSSRTADEHIDDELEPKGREDYELKEFEEEEGFEDSLKLKLDDDEKSRIADEIISLAADFDVARQKWLDEWKEMRQYKEDELPEKTFPWEGCSQFHDPMIFKSGKAIKARCSQVIWGNGDRAVWKFKPTEKSDIDACKRKEKYMDFTTVVEMKLEEVYNFVDDDAVYLGAGFMALTRLKDMRRVKDVEIYDPSKDPEIEQRNTDPLRDKDAPKELPALEKFLKNYLNARTKYPEIYNRLAAGEKIELNVSYSDTIYNAAKAEWVKPEDMIADPKIIEPERQVLYGRWRHFTKNELLRYKEDKYFENVDKVLNFENEDKEQKQKTDTDTYDVAEVIFYYKGNMCLFWIERDSKQYLRGVSYIYDHMHPFIIPFYSEDSGEEFYRHGVAYRLKNLNIAVNSIVRQAIDVNAVNFPVFSSEDPSFNPNLWSFYPLCNVPPGLKQVPISTGNSVPESINLAQILSRKADDISSTSLLTGRESPSDPTAPASKTAMLIRESGINISTTIKMLKSAMREVGFQIAQLEYQFGDKKKQYRILNSIAFEDITSEDLRIRGDFVPVGTLEYAEPELVFQKNKFLYEAGSKNPMIAQNPVIMAELWRNLVVSTGDLWEMMVDRLAPMPWEALEMKADFEEKMQEKTMEIAEKRAREEAVKIGRSPEDIELSMKALFSKFPNRQETPPVPAEGMIPNGQLETALPEGEAVPPIA